MCSDFHWFLIDFHSFVFFSSIFMITKDFLRFLKGFKRFIIAGSGAIVFPLTCFICHRIILFSCGAAPGRPLAYSPAQNQTLNLWARASQLPILLISAYLDRFHLAYLTFIDVTMILNRFSCISIWILLISIDFFVFSTIIIDFHRFSHDFLKILMDSSPGVIVFSPICFVCHRILFQLPSGVRVSAGA